MEMVRAIFLLTGSLVFSLFVCLNAAVSVLSFDSGKSLPQLDRQASSPQMECTFPGISVSVFQYPSRKIQPWDSIIPPGHVPELFGLANDSGKIHCGKNKTCSRIYILPNYKGRAPPESLWL